MSRIKDDPSNVPANVVWKTGAFVGGFGDAFLADTELEGGQTAPSCEVLASVLRQAIAESPELGLIRGDEAKMAALDKVAGHLELAADLGYKIMGAGEGAKFVHLLRDLLQRLAALKVGELFPIQGGWSGTSGGHAIFYIFERTAEDMFAFTVVNTGQGVQYHPASMSDYPKEKRRIAMRLPGCARSRVLDEGFLFMLFQLQSNPREENTPEMVYEVLLPHLLDGNLLDADARNVEEAKERPELLGGFTTCQRAGMCYYKCVVAVTRYLLQRHGLTTREQKQTLFAVRCVYLDRAIEDLNRCSALEDADVRLLHMACQQTALCAVKEEQRGNLNTDGLERVHAQIERARELIADLPKVGSSFESPELLEMETVSAPLRPFPGFDLLVEERSTHRFAGGISEAVPELFVDLTDGGRATTFEQTVEAVQRAKVQCDKLRAKTSVSEASISMHQIIALVHHLTTVVLEVPQPWTPELAARDETSAWVPRSLTISTQRSALSAIHAVFLHFVTAVKSVEYDRTTGAANLIATSALVAAFDAVVRLRATSEVPESDASGTAGAAGGAGGDGPGASAPSDRVADEGVEDRWLILKHRGPAPLSEVLHKFSEPLSDGVLGADPDEAASVARRLEAAKPKTAVATTPPEWHLAAKSAGGEDLAQLTQYMLITSPHVARTRDKLIAYFNASSGQGKELFTLGRFQRDAYLYNDKHDALLFMQALIDSIGHSEEMPPNTVRHNAQGFATDGERRARWLCYSWEHLPEVAQMRDIAVLCRVMMEPDPTQQLIENKLWFTSNARCQFTYVTGMQDGGAVLKLRVFRNKKMRLGGKSNLAEMTNPREFVAVESGRPSLSEEDILFATSLKTFDDNLSTEDAEKLVSYLTAPYLRIPLILGFFADNRVGCLFNGRLQLLLERVLFEPQAHYVPSPGERVDVVPIADSARHLLGTQFGLLFNELRFAPAATLEPLLELCQRALSLCVGSYSSSFVDLWLYLLRLLNTAEGFLVGILGVEGDDAVDPSIAYVMVELKTRIRNFTHGSARAKLLQFMSECEQAGDVGSATRFHAHHAILYAYLSDDEMTMDMACAFLASCAFVIAWNCQGTEVKTASAEAESDSDEEGDGDPMAMFLGMMRGSAAKKNTDDTDGRSHSLPLPRVFEAMQRQRPHVMEWIRSASEDELDTLCSQVLGVSLRRGQLHAKNWETAERTPVFCQRQIQSEHPYMPGTNFYETVSFPGAPWLRIEFSDRTKTEPGNDYVTIYKDSSCTEHWGATKRLSGGLEGGWPGAGGRPPLIIPSDHFTLHFNSDLMNEEWGFCVTVTAPPAPQFVEQLCGEDMTGSTDKWPSRWAQKALAISNNDIDAARKYLRDNVALLRAQDAEEEAKVKAEEEEGRKKPISGLFRDPSGATEVNLQTAEVYMRGRMAMPVPEDIARMDDFQRVFGMEVPLCAVMATTTNRRWVKVFQRGFIYDVHAWTPVDISQSARALSSLTPGQEVPSGAGEAFWGMPVKYGPAVHYLGRKYEHRYEPKTLGWVSTILDKELGTEKKEGAHGHGSGREEERREADKRLWVSDAGLAALGLRADPEDGVIAIAGGDDDDVVASEQEDAPVSALLMWVPPRGGVAAREARLGHWFEIFVSVRARVLRVFELHEHGRLLYRSEVFTSDCRASLHDMEQDIEDRTEPSPAVARFAAGSFTGTAADDDGPVVEYGGSAQVPQEAQEIVSVGSVNIERCRDASWDQIGTESLVPSRFLRGVIPTVLLEAYEFWRSSANRLRGYPLDPEVDTYIDVRIQSPDGPPGSPRKSKATEAKYPRLSSGALITKRALAKLRQPNRPATETEPASGDFDTSGDMRLLNIANARRNSFLGRLARWVARLDNLSHVLVWSTSRGEVEDECEVSIVHLPRLKATFKPKVGDDGVARLYSLDHAGLFVTDRRTESLLELMRGIPQSVVLENKHRELFLMVPNVSVHRPKIRSVPFASDLVLSRPQDWADTTSTRFYLYAVHPSGAFLETPSLSSAFYLVLLRLMHRDYEIVSRLLSACSSDIELQREEAWVFDMLGRTAEDKHPDAHALRMRLALVAFESGHEVPYDVSADYAEYISKLSHVSAVCRLKMDEEETLLRHVAMSGEMPSRLETRMQFLQAVGAMVELDEARKLSLEDDTVDSLLPPMPRGGTVMRRQASSTVVRRETFESPHPYPLRYSTTHKVSFEGAETIVVRFDALTKTDKNESRVRFFLDEACEVPVPGARSFYSGSVEDGAWPGAGDAPPLVVMGDSVYMTFSASGDKQDWGYKVSFTADAPMKPLGISRALSAAGVPPAPPAPGAAVPLSTGLSSLSEEETASLDLQAPAASNGGAMFDFVDKITPNAVQAYASQRGWPVKLRYARPDAEERSGSRAISALNETVKDELSGRRRSKGFFFLLELMKGHVHLNLARPASEDEAVAAADAKEAAEEAKDGGASESKEEPPLSRYGKGCFPVAVGRKDAKKTYVDAFDEGTELINAGCNWTIAKLTAQLLFLKETEFGKKQPDFNNPEMWGFVFLNVMSRAAMADSTLALGLMDNFPGVPVEGQAEHFEGVGLTMSEGLGAELFSQLTMGSVTVCMHDIYQALAARPSAALPPLTSSVQLTIADVPVARPDVTDYAASRRELTEISTNHRSYLERGIKWAKARSLASATARFGVVLDAAEVKAHAGIPLRACQLNRHVFYAPAPGSGEDGCPPLDAELPFDVSGHKDAVTHVGQQMLHRLSEDMKFSAGKVRGATVPRLRYLHDVHLRALRENLADSADELGFDEATATYIAYARSRLLELRDGLAEMQAEDTAFVSTHVRGIERATNAISADRGERDHDRLLFLLTRQARHRPRAWFSLLTSALLSTAPAKDLEALNPFLTKDERMAALDAVVVVLLRTSRVSHLNRCIAAIDDLVASMQKLVQTKVTDAIRGSYGADALTTPEMVTQALKMSNFHAVDAVRHFGHLHGTVEVVARFAVDTGIAERESQSVALLALHLCDFDERTACRNVLNGAEVERISKLAQMGCFYAGRRLPPLSKGVLQTSGSTVAMVHVLQHSSDNIASMLMTKRFYMRNNTPIGVHVSDSIVRFEYDPRFLVFEYMFNYILRGRQVELVREMYKTATSKGGKTSQVSQMIMGAGKTTVIGPLLALMLADGESLVMQVVPQALLAQTIAVMRARFSSVISKRLFTLNFDRASEASSSVPKLEQLLAKLRLARQTRSIVCSTPESVKSVMLKYVDLLQNVYSVPTEALLPPAMLPDKYRTEFTTLAMEARNRAAAADRLAAIIRMWGAAEKGRLLLDEVDVLLHPLRSELNFPIGPSKMLHFNPSRWLLPMWLLDAFFYASRGRVALENYKSTEESIALLDDLRDAVAAGIKSCDLQGSPHLVLLRPAFYHDQLRCRAARWLMLYLRSVPELQHDVGTAAGGTAGGAAAATADEESNPTVLPDAVSEEASSAAARSEPFPETAAAEMLAYISGEASMTSSTADWVEANCSGTSIMYLNLSRDWITSLLPHCLSKINRVAYGLLNEVDQMRWGQEVFDKMPESRKILAVPFVGKDVPSRAAEFAHPDVLIGLSILASRYEGLRRGDVKTTVKQLKTSLMRESGPFSERPSRVLFDEWLHQGWINHKILQRLSDADDDDDAAGGGDASAATDVDDPTADAEKPSTGGDTPVSGAHGFDVLPLELLQPDDERQMAEVFKALGKTPEFILYWLTTREFPRLMHHQDVKLTASGMDLGSDILFDSRLGFSGTPSDLMPDELGGCRTEPGSDAKILRVLTSNEFVGYDRISDWSVNGLLRKIARADPPYHALIDTGALITGMTNEEVARYLLAKGLHGLDGCVYLDASDNKMVILRDRVRPVPLQECGLPPHRRFTFYDQVHTTGTDIKQGLDARAAVTLGKDMTFRDYAQGCWRMRGLGKGQTITLVIVDELQQLIDAVADPEKSVPINVAAWLVVNGMRSEKLQHMQLCVQKLNHIWRRRAFHDLLRSEAPERGPSDSGLRTRFHESVSEEVVHAIVKQLEVQSAKEDAASAAAAGGAAPPAPPAAQGEIPGLPPGIPPQLAAMIDTDMIRSMAAAGMSQQQIAQQVMQSIMMGLNGGSGGFGPGGMPPIGPGDMPPMGPGGLVGPSGGGGAGESDMERAMRLSREMAEGEAKSREASDGDRPALQPSGRLVAFHAHPLKEAEVAGGYRCDKCQGADDKRFTCAAGEDFDLCGRCMAAEVATAEATSGGRFISIHPHPLKSVPVGERGYFCDNCRGADGDRFSCTADCDFDLCSSCMAIELSKEEAGPPATDAAVADTTELSAEEAEARELEAALALSAQEDEREAKARAEAQAAVAAMEPTDDDFDDPEMAAAIALSMARQGSDAGDAAGAATEETKAEDAAPVADEAGAPEAEEAKSEAAGADEAATAGTSATEDSGTPDAAAGGDDESKGAEDAAAELWLVDTTVATTWLGKCIMVFCEELDLQVRDTVPRPVAFSEVLENIAEEHSDFLGLPGAAEAKAKVLEEAATATTVNVDLSLGTEMVQEQEQEEDQEQQVQQTKQRVPVCAKDPTPQQPWEVAALAHPTQLITASGTFYALADFRTRTDAEPLPFPRSVLLTDNYARRHHSHSLPRRLKNVTITLDWQAPGTEESALRLVMLSLAEAEALRRAIHLGHHALATGEELSAEPAERAGKALARLRLVDGRLLDFSPPELEDVAAAGGATDDAVAASPLDIAVSTVRFFDNQMWFSEHQLIALLEAVKEATVDQRQQFFKEVIRSRRRDRQAWEDTSLAGVFAHRDAEHLVRLRVWARVVREAIESRGWTLRHAFDEFDIAGNGWIGPAELHRGLTTLGVALDSAKVMELMKAADRNSDGTLNYLEFATRFADAEADDAKEREEHDAQMWERMTSHGPGIIMDAVAGSRTGQAAQSASAGGGTSAAGAADLFDVSAAETPADIEATPSRRREVTVASHIDVAHVMDVGQLFETSGGQALILGGGMLLTRSGFLPTIAPRGIVLRSGKHYFELTVVHAGHATVGWADVRYTGDSREGRGVGSDEFSWGLSSGYSRTVLPRSRPSAGLTRFRSVSVSMRRSKSRSASSSLSTSHHGAPLTGFTSGGVSVHGSVTRSCGPQWASGDVIGCAVDVDAKTMHFFVNGKPVDGAEGLVFSDVAFETGLIPVTSYDSSFVGLLNMGTTPFRYRYSEGSGSINRHAQRVMEERMVAEAGTAAGRIIATSGDSALRIDGYGLATTGQGFPSATLAGVLLTRGKWYYEINIGTSGGGMFGGVAQLGWADCAFIGSSGDGQGCGDDKHSWGFDGSRECLWAGTSVPFGKKWRAGSILGVAIDLDEKVISFSLDGDYSAPMGAWDTKISFTGGVTPAFTLQSFELHVNFGNKPLSHAPPSAEYHTVFEWMLDHGVKAPKSEISAATPALPPGGLSIARGVSVAYTSPLADMKHLQLRMSSGFELVLLDNESRTVSCTRRVASAVADGVLLQLGRGGRFYYEVTVDRPGNGACIGWADREFFGSWIDGRGVGDDRHSWGYSGREHRALHNHSSKAVDGDRPSWRTGSVIGCAIDMDLMTMRIVVDAVWHDVYSVGDFASVVDGLRPAISVQQNTKITVNFGEFPFVYDVPSHVPEHSSMHEHLLLEQAEA